MHQHSNDGEDDDHSSRSLAVVAILNFLGFLAELVGGFLFGSVALLSDAFHMLFDMLAYSLAFGAAYYAENYEREEEINYSIHRIEPLAAFINGFLLIPMVGYILWESYQRYLSPVSIDPIPVICIAILGLLVNIISVFVLHDDAMSLNERGAFYHLLGDAGGSIAVIVSVLVIQFTGWNIVDPIVASGIGILILWSAYKVLSESSLIFMHHSPIDKTEIKELVSEIDGVEDVGCVHSWQICSQINVATVHAKISQNRFEDMGEVNREIHHVLSHNGVDHATIELRGNFDEEPNHLTNHDH